MPPVCSSDANIREAHRGRTSSGHTPNLLKCFHNDYFVAENLEIF